MALAIHIVALFAGLVLAAWLVGCAIELVAELLDGDWQ